MVYYLAMKFNQCKKEIVQYILDYENSKVFLTPSIEVFNYVFDDKYTPEEISKNSLDLVFLGILESYGWFKYLRLTKTIKFS